MKPRIALLRQRQRQPQPVTLPFSPSVQLVDIACLLRTRGLRVRWSIQRRALEIVPV